MTKEKIYTVYLHIFPHEPSLKFYVGLTGFDPKKRWGKNGIGYKHHQKLMWNAIQKYGWDNIKHKILFTSKIKEEAEEKEIEYISYYKSDNCEFGYNIKHGGYKSEKPCPRKDISGEKNPQYGKHWWTNGKENILSKECPGEDFYRGTLPRSQEIIEAIRLKRTGKKGHTPTEETKEKIRKKLSGKSNPQYGKRWWNNGETKIFSKECPGEGWVLGYIISERNLGFHWYNNGYEQIYTKENLDETKWKRGKLPMSEEGKEKLKKINIGKKCWTDGKTNVISETCPNENFKRGMIKRNPSAHNKNKRAWNKDGKTIYSEKCPGEGWKQGNGKRYSKEEKMKISKKLKGKCCGENSTAWGRHWWNNGKENLYQKDNPGEGWVLGRIYKRK